MAKLTLDISMSLDGFIAGPRPTLEAPLGEGGMQLHEWAFATRTFRERHGMDVEGGERGTDDDVIAESVAAAGATVMGRRMFSGGSGPWEADPNVSGWWGDEPPFHHPVFVLTHHPREPLELEGGTTFTFVTGGVESAVEQARAVAGGRDVAVGGGAEVARQALAAGLLDELRVHIVPVLLGDGVRLFAGSTARLERVRLLESPSGVVHVSYRVPSS